MRYFSMFSGIGGFELGIIRAFSIWDGAATSAEPETSKQGVESASESEGDDRTSTSSSSTGEPRQVLCVGYSEIDKYAIKVYERRFNGNSVGTQQGQQEEQRGEVRDKVPYETDSGNTQRAIGQSTGLYNRGRHHNYGDATTINPTNLPDFDLLVGGFPCQAFSVAGKRAGFNDTRGTLFFDIARILKDKRPGHLVLENVKGLLSHDQGKTFQVILGVLSDLGYRVEWQVLNSKDFGVPQNRERVFIVGHLGGECGRKVFPITGSSQQIATVAGYISEEAWPRRHEQIRRTYNTDGAMPTIPTGQGGGVMTKIYQKPRIRRLTPKECERLQGFPVDWTAGESDTQRYKMCGNAVTTNVVEAVITNLLPCLTNKLEDKS